MGVGGRGVARGWAWDRAQTKEVSTLVRRILWWEGDSPPHHPKNNGRRQTTHQHKKPQANATAEGVGVGRGVRTVHAQHARGRK